VSFLRQLLRRDGIGAIIFTVLILKALYLLFWFPITLKQHAMAMEFYQQQPDLFKHFEGLLSPPRPDPLFWVVTSTALEFILFCLAAFLIHRCADLRSAPPWPKKED